jgi:hypothetical protein
MRIDLMGIKKLWEALTSSIDKKTRLLAIIWLIALSVALGCVSGSSGPYPTYAHPNLPHAVTGEAFIKCGDDYYCISPEHLDGLREYVIRLDSLVQKYENAINEINKLE